MIIQAHAACCMRTVTTMAPDQREFSASKWECQCRYIMAKTWRKQVANDMLLWLAPLSHLGGLSVAVCFCCFLCCLSRGRSCYLYPSEMRDPCKGKVCNFGASCVASLDGLTARCQCPERCNSFGDAVGSGPVCGSDGQNYESLCQMKKRACEDMKEIEKIYVGKCGE